MRLLKSLSLFLAIVLLLLAVPFLLPKSTVPVADVDSANLPWKIERLAEGGTKVFGIVLGKTSLDEIKPELGSDVVVAMVAAPGESGAVEAYYERFDAGFVSGRLLLSLETTLAEREAMLKRAVKTEFMDSTTRRISLSEADLTRVGQVRITGISFIPAAQLDEAIILQRFGQPAQRIRQGDSVEHFLYPEKGLDIALNSKSKEVLQYVAPQDFARLSAPLRDGVPVAGQ